MWACNKMLFQNVSDSYSNESLSLEWVFFCLYIPVVQTVEFGASNAEGHGFDSEFDKMLNAMQVTLDESWHCHGPKWAIGKCQMHKKSLRLISVKQTSDRLSCG